MVGAAPCFPLYRVNESKIQALRSEIQGLREEVRQLKARVAELKSFEVVTPEIL